MPAERFWVASDLDGTLLDHSDYSWHAALPALNLLRQKSIPLVINTSKTRAEVEDLQKQLQIQDPFIVENGSALIFPCDPHSSKDCSVYKVVLGYSRAKIVALLQALRREFSWKFESYSDWSLEELCEHTGLSAQAAAKSQNREYSEPLLWKDTEENFIQFKTQLAAQGLSTLQGGRFIHVLGSCNKGSALCALQNFHYRYAASKLICLGDSANDLDMLAIADHPIFIRSPAHDFPTHCGKNAAMYSNHFGPTGWNEMLMKLLL